MEHKLRFNIKTFSCQSFLTLVSIIIYLFFSADVMAQGDLLINPKRVVFDGQKRSQEIDLANTGKDTARYVVSFIQIRMKEDGNFEEISQPDSGQNFSSKYLRIFPRTVTLAPNEAQVVKVQVSQANKLIAGEYRSHLYFRAVPEETPLGEKSKAVDTTAISIKLTPVFGISIPIIIRVGGSTAKISLSNLQLETFAEAAPVFKIRFNRTGNMSVYGDLKVQHISSDGKVTQAAIINGISVYTPNRIRDVRIELDDKSGINYKKGLIRVIYTSSSNAKPEQLASAELALQ